MALVRRDDAAAETASQASAKKRRRVADTVDLYDEILGDRGASPAPAEMVAAPEAEADLGVLKPLSRAELERYNAKTDRSGIVYLSRIPPGMGPSQVRHQLGRHGDIGRVFLQKDERDTAKSSKKKRATHQAHRFVEGWVEFEDKKVARGVADMLNAQTIGGPKSSPFHDDIWTMKYLPKFKWSMLSEQVALEASTQAALLRSHLAQSKRDQAAYLDQVERARIDVKRAEKRKAREQQAHERGETLPTATSKERAFSQRTAVGGKSRGEDRRSKELGAVLDKLF